MTLSEFQQRYGTDWKIMLASDMGKAALETLREIRMPPNCDPVEHQVAYRLGGIAGYEECLARMVALSVVRTQKTPPLPNYGVPDKPLEQGESREMGQ